MDEVTIRKSIPEDTESLKEWFKERQVLQWFPMCNEKEVEDSVKVWLGGIEKGYVLTAVYKGEPCGMANLYVQTFEKLKHQCLFAIIVKKEMRGKGVGTKLVQGLFSLAREHGVELLHLEVYDGNPAEKFYEKMGFTKYGYEKNFIKEEGKYAGKVLMQIQL